jgi:hypothetical protein
MVRLAFWSARSPTATTLDIRGMVGMIIERGKHVKKIGAVPIFSSKPLIIELGHQGMDRSTVGATIPLETQRSRKIIKIPGSHNHVPTALGSCTEDTTEDGVTDTSCPSSPKA